MNKNLLSIWLATTTTEVCTPTISVWKATAWKGQILTRCDYNFVLQAAALMQALILLNMNATDHTTSFTNLQFWICHWKQTTTRHVTQGTIKTHNLLSEWLSVKVVYYNAVSVPTTTATTFSCNVAFDRVLTKIQVGTLHINLTAFKTELKFGTTQNVTKLSVVMNVDVSLDG